MIPKSLPVSPAVRGFAAAFLALFTAAALAQDPAPAEEATPAADPAAEAAAETPAEATAPADAAPAEAAGDAPAETPAETVEQTIPVNTEEPATPPNASKLDTIQVTGSRLKRTDYETAQPVFSLSREDIDRSGLTDISQLLAKIPAAGNASLNTQAQARTTSLGETNLDLRNLGSTRTLLLVNGRRWANGLISTQPSVADFNTIPTSIIDRIEVLKDGASAIYGSDAIGGVVNVITRKDYEGWGLSSQLGQYVSEGDGVKQQHSVSWGMVRPGTSLFANLSYTEEGEALTSNRPFTASPHPVMGLTRWGNAIPTGRFLFIPTSNNGTRYQCPNLQGGLAGGTIGGGPLQPVGGAAGSSGAIPAGLQLCDLTWDPDAIPAEPDPNDYRMRVPTNIEDRYNHYQDTVMQQPSQRTTLFTAASTQLSDTITGTFEGLYTMRRSTGVYGALTVVGGDAFGTDAFISAANELNPFGQDIGNSQGTGLAPGYGAFIMRLPDEERAIWKFHNVADTIRLAWGLNGEFDAVDTSWFWDTGYITTKAKNNESTPLVRFDHLKLAVGPTVDCVAPCVPFDLFHGQNNVTKAALDYLYADTTQFNDGRQDILYANVASSFNVPGDFLAGPLAIAGGIEYRRDEFSTIPDPLVQAGLTFLNQQQPLSGKAYAREAFVELGIPLLADRPFVEALDLSLAGRYSRYPGFGSVATYKTGLRWNPIDDVLVRGTYSTGFRAPNIGELYLTPAQSFDPMNDPCITPSPQAEQNCTDDGVNPDLAEQTAGQPFALWQGDKELNPEKSKNLTYGIVYSPSYVPDLNVYVDFYAITIEDYITIGGSLAQFILDSCYEVPTGERTYCERVHRGGHPLESVDTPYTNYSTVKTAGVDFGFDYLLPVTPAAGRYKVALDVSRLDKYETVRPRPGQASETKDWVGISDLLTGWPEWKAGASLTWQFERFSASWSTRMAYSMTEPCVDPYQPAPHTFGVCSDPNPAVADDLTTPDVDEGKDDTSMNTWKTVFYHNVQVGYELPQWNADITLGVNNVLDQLPQESFGLTGFYWYNYDPNQYELPGRFGYVRLDVKF